MKREKWTRREGAKEKNKNREMKIHCIRKGHVSNRHMTWWQNAWWVRVNNGPHMRTAEGGVESGEQPDSPNRLATKSGSERPRVKREKETGTDGEKDRADRTMKPLSTLSCTYPLQHQQQQQQQQQ